MINKKLFNKFQFFLIFTICEESLNINETNEKRANIFISYLKKFPPAELITSLKIIFFQFLKKLYIK